MDPSCHKLPEPHKGVRGEGRGVLIVRGCRVFGDPILEEQVFCAGPKGLVGSLHEFWWGNVRPGWGEGM